MGSFAWKLGLFATLALALQILLSLDYSRPKDPGPGPAGRLRLPVVRLPALDAYRPDSQILLFQSHMRTHASLGFVFRENLGREKTLELQWADQDAGAVTTDSSGFINSPYAISARQAGKRVNIAGVGSSFMQGAAAKFHDFFWAKGLFYYNLATPRHTLPQFTTAVAEYAIPLRPDWILYDVNEASFELIQDYENWSASGLDWFAYHSGTWCGPPRRKPLPVLSAFPPLEALYAGVRRKVAPSRPVPEAPDGEIVGKALGHIVAARDAARRRGIRLLVLVIPGKDRVVEGKSRRWHRVEALLPLLAKEGVAVLNLLPIFAAEDDPRALYYQVDAHWNDYGIFKAGVAVAQYLAGTQGEKTEPDAPEPAPVPSSAPVFPETPPISAAGRPDR